MARTVLAIDPSFRATGAVVVRVARKPALVTCKLIQTEKAKGKVLVAHDDWFCLQLIVKALLELVERHDPAALLVETPAGSKDVRGAKSMAYAYAICACIGSLRDLPHVLLSAGEVKKRLTGDRGASKAAVAAEVASWVPEGVLRRYGSRQRENITDAAGLVVAAWDEPVMRVIRQMRS